MAAPKIPVRMGLAEFLQFAEAAEGRFELHDGVVVAMAGGSLRHAQLGLAFGAELRSRLKGQGCQVFGPDLFVSVGRDGVLMPDVTVVCGSPQVAEEDKRALVNPLVVVEVLSASTEAYDRGRKFDLCRRLASLREVVLVSQEEAVVQVFSLEGGLWVLRDFRGTEAVARLGSLGVEVPLSEVYEGTAELPAG